jgi:exonuclease III
LKILTWNLGFWQHRFHHQTAWAYLRNDIKPDLALLQETGDVKLQQDECFLFKPIHQNWGTALYTRNIPIHEVKIEKYPNRVAAASLDLPGNRKVVAVSVHAPIINGRVFPFLEEIFGEIENRVCNKAFVVGGDLNTARLAEFVWPRHGHGHFFERLAKSIFFDCHRKFHNIEQQTFFRNGCRYPFQDDHLFVSYDLANKVKLCEVLNNEFTRNLSDHIPLVAEVEL